MNENRRFEVFLEKADKQINANGETVPDHKKVSPVEHWQIEEGTANAITSKALEDVKSILKVPIYRIPWKVGPPRYKSYQMGLTTGNDDYRLVFLDLDVTGYEFANASKQGELMFEKYDPEKLTASSLRQRIRRIICRDRQQKREGKSLTEYDLVKICCTICQTPYFPDNPNGLDQVHIHHIHGRNNEAYKNACIDEVFIIKNYDVLCAWCHAIHHSSLEIALFAMSIQQRTWIYQQMEKYLLTNIEIYKSTEKALALDDFYHVFEAVQKEEKKRIKTFKDYIEEYKKHFNGTRIISMIEFVNKKEGYNLTNSILLDKDVEIILELLEWNRSYELWYAPNENIPKKRTSEKKIKKRNPEKENAIPVDLEAELEPVEGWGEALKKMITRTCEECSIQFSYGEDSPFPWEGVLYNICWECSASHSSLN